MPSVRYGVSICAMLPRQTTLVPGPARVISVFICLGVRFCASSMIRYLLMKVRPRMKLSALHLDAVADQVGAWPRAPSRPPRRRCASSTSRLSSSAPIQGVIFSSSVPGRKPMSSPTGTVTRVMMISL